MSRTINNQSKFWPAVSAYIGIFLFGIVIVSLGSLLPYLTEKYNLVVSQGGTLASLLALGILLGSITFGPMTDRYSYKRPLIIATIAISLGMEMLFIRHFWFLLQLAFVTIGFGGGMMNGITAALINEISGTDQKARSANFSILGVFYGIGALGTPAMLRILTVYFTYEQIFKTAGWLMLIPVGIFFFISFPEVRHKISFSLSVWWKMAKQPALILFGLVAFFQGSLESLANNWTTSFLSLHAGFDMPVSLMILSLFMASYTIGRLLLGWLFNKLPSHVIILISLSLIASGLLLAALFSNLPVFLAAYILLGLGLAAGFPFILGYIGAIFTKASGTAFSIVMTFALVGNILSNYGMGLLALHFSIGILPWFQFILTGMMGIFIFLAIKSWNDQVN